MAGFSHGIKNKRKHLPRKDTEFHGRKNKHRVPREIDESMVAKPKSANGAVAVGLPHRNRSVFKQAHINKRQVKGNDPSSAVDGLEDDVGG